MLDAETKRTLEQRYFPELEEVVFAPLHRALDQEELAGALVLDAGCGTGTWIVNAHRERYRFVVGVDIYDPGAHSADAFALASLEHLPFRDAAFDLVVCYLVLEHVAAPDKVFREFARVLRPGGTLIFKVPAAYAPTILLARVLPYRLHWFLKRFVGADKGDVFPTYYRCNTVSRLERLLHENGLRGELTRVDQTYAYLSMNRWSYVAGLCYSRAVHHPQLARLRSGIIGVCRKDEAI